MKFFFKKIIASILSSEARLVLKKYNPKIVGVTGSVGKTSTKDAIYTVLTSTYFSRKSDKSFNSDLGIPLTILGLPNAWSNPLLWIKNIIEGLLLVVLPMKYPEWLVLEVGADGDRPTYMTELSKWLKTDITVFTSFAETPVHVEFFGSRENLFMEKLSLVHALKEQGTLILSHDDEEVRRIQEIVNRKTLTYGFGIGANIHASHAAITYGVYDHSDLEFPKGMTCRVNYEGNSMPIELIGALGQHHIYPLLAAFAVGISLGINPVKITEALEKHVSPKGRMKLLAGIKDTVIIDDTYNSSPTAVHAALYTLRDCKTAGRKIAILGDMLELGEYSIDEHKKVGVLAAQSADILVTVGVRSRQTADAALDTGMDEKNDVSGEKV
jgi:UDP-N-acetylmuramoyl-tripeptide--D-alanyl-D-alanine ligase